VPSDHDPAESLVDIIENAERIEGYLTGMDRDTFAASGLVRDAVERCLSESVRPHTAWVSMRPRLMPDQPWSDIRGMGNRLRHAYDRISLDVIWNAARYDLPGLTADARRVLLQIRVRDQLGKHGE
jgi:uncharacterized protein with HEPN domain